LRHPFAFLIRREVEPIMATIDRSLEMVSGRNGANDDEIRDYRRRLEELRSFLATMGALFELVLRFGDSGIGRLTRLMAAPATRGESARKRPKAGRT
jgi:hypothetical protein